MSTTDSVEALKVRDSFLGLSFFCDKILIVEFEGPPRGEESVIDTRIEGFNTPWLHIENDPVGVVFKNEIRPEGIFLRL